MATMSIGLNIPDSAAIAADKLAMSIQDFVAAGNQVTELPGFTFKPRPQRSHPKAKSKQKRTRRVAANILRYQTHGKELTSLWDKGIPISIISADTGLGEAFIRNCLQYHGRDTSRTTHRHMGKTLRLVAELKAMADDRYTMRYAATCAGITPVRCAELAAEYEIAFRPEAPQ